MSSHAQNAALGAVAVVLGYALWHHFKPAAKVRATPGAPVSGTDPTKPDIGYGYDPENPGDYISNKDLINGTISDVYTGNREGYDIPTNSELFASVVHDTYNAPERQQSIVQVNNGNWWQL